MRLLGDATPTIDGFLLASPKPSSTDVANFLRLYTNGDRDQVARELIARGVSPTTIANALAWLNNEAKWNVDVLKNVLTVAAAGAAAFHGYRRNRGSIGWGVVWFLSGIVFPVITTAFGFAQGFGKSRTS